MENLSRFCSWRRRHMWNFFSRISNLQIWRDGGVELMRDMGVKLMTVEVEDNNSVGTELVVDALVGPVDTITAASRTFSYIADRWWTATEEEIVYSFIQVRNACINSRVMIQSSLDELDPGARRTVRIAQYDTETVEVLNHLELTMDQLINFCIVSACDYCESIKGIGGNREPEVDPLTRLHRRGYEKYL